jgi:serine/threonine protein kinase
MFLGERYQLLEPIHHGGMAIVYRCRDLQTDRIVAIKVFNKAYGTDQAFVQRFQQEAMLASALEHPNIVQGYTYGQTDDAYYIVMELVEGTDLRRYLRSRGQLASDRAAMIAHDIALGLGAVHRLGIVHKNVNPQHIYDAPVLPSQLNPNIPLALEVVVLCSLKKVPAMRYQDGVQLALALDTLQGK